MCPLIYLNIFFSINVHVGYIKQKRDNSTNGSFLEHTIEAKEQCCNFLRIKLLNNCYNINSYIIMH